MKRWIFPGLMLVVLSFCSGFAADEIRVPGIVDGDVLTLKAAATGEVVALRVREGIEVAEGAPLLRIDSRKIENQLAGVDLALAELGVKQEQVAKNLTLATADADHIERQVGRFRRLKETQAIAGENLETMELRLLQARTRQFDLRQSLKSLEIQAKTLANKRDYLELVLRDHHPVCPVAGIVTETLVSVGETVFPGTPLIEILDRDSLFVEVFVEEVELGGLRLGQRVRIAVDGNEDRALTGRIALFGQKAEFSPKYVISEKERQSLLYRVKISVSQDRDILKVGMPVTVVMNRNPTGSGDA